MGSRDRVFLRADILGEQRENGTQLQTNSTGLGTIALSWARQLTNDNVWVSSYHTRESFHSTFSAPQAGRNSELQTTAQESPSEASGLAGLWRHNASSWNAVFGSDFTHVEGFSRDWLYTSGVRNGNQRFGAGSRNSAGGYAQWNGKYKMANLYLGSRFDSLGNGRAFYSPSGGITVGRGIWRARASMYRSFRSPTLNELYRIFRVGNTVTNANDQLKPEKLFGAEVGFDLIGERRRFSLTGYRNSMADVVTNVTVGFANGAIQRQRQNVGGVTSLGLEANLRENWGTHWQGQISYLFVDSEFNTGVLVPQIARHQGSAQLSWVNSKMFISGGVRAYSAQFEDDINTLRMGGYATVQLAAKYMLRPSLALTAEVDNALDRTYTAGLPNGLAVPVTGAPQLYRFGIRWDGAWK
jgi:outer membrane cobalamin receptor